MLAPHSLGHHVGADEQRDLDTNTSEADAGAADLRARRDVVVARQLTPAHADPVVHDGESGGRRIRRDCDGRGAGIEGVGDDLGEDGLLGGRRISVAQILEQVEQIDPRLAQTVALRPTG